MATDGWIFLHRRIVENELWKEPFDKARAWIDLLLLANFKDSSFWVRGQEVRVKRGQLAWSIEKLSARWRWNRKTVMRFLLWLENGQQITQQRSNVTTLISIINYEKYQLGGTAEGITEGTAERTAEGTHKKEGKEKKQTIPTELAGLFNQFWSAYPKKIARGAAEKSFSKIKPSKDLLEQMLAAVKQQSASDAWIKEGGQYIPNPSTWLNQRRWEDEPLLAPLRKREVCL